MKNIIQKFFAKKNIVIVFAVALLLQGCFALALVAGASIAGGAIVADQRNAKTILEDKDLSYRIQSRLNKDKTIKDNSHVEVASFNGIVLLAGQVPTAQIRDQIVSIVNTINGIKLLHNEIIVSNVSSMSDRAKDSWLTTKVKSAMVAEQGLISAQIKIVTESGVVYLMGIVSHVQGDLAGIKASQVSGVTRVVKLFEYIQ